MANMGYCRFRNTAKDLMDCLDNWDNDNISDEEEKAKKIIIELAQEIVALNVIEF